MNVWKNVLDDTIELDPHTYTKTWTDYYRAQYMERALVQMNRKDVADDAREYAEERLNK